MEKSKLIEVLKTFEASEFKRFEEFCESPYFNKNQSLSKLCSELRKAYPKFSAKTIAKEKMFSKLFPEEKYSDQRMRDLISALFKLVELFISVNLLREDTFRQKLDLLRSYQKKSLSKYFASGYDEAKKILEENKDSDVFYNRFLLESEKIAFTEEHELNNLKNILLKANQIPIPYEVVSAWHLQKTLILHLIELNLAKQVGHKTFKEFDKAYFEKQIKLLPEYKHYFEPYFLLLNFLTYKDEKLFPFLMEVVDSKALDVFSKEDQLLFFKILANYCIQKAHGGDHTYNVHQFDLYTILFKRKLHITKGKMDTNLFSNYVFQGLLLNQIDGIVEFIDANGKYLEESVREDTVSFCLCLYHYHKKDFKTAQKFFNKIDPENTFQGKVDLRMLQIKLFYELGDYESLLVTIDSFRHLLSENVNIPGHRVDLYLKMVAMIRTLGGIGLKPTIKDKPALLQLKEKAESTIGTKGVWVINRIDALLKSIT